MSDIQAGDLVVAVGAERQGLDPKRFVANAPFKRNEIVRVERVVASAPWDVRGIIIIGKDGLWGEICFRKLNDEPDNAEITALIKRPVRKPVEA